jgi:hypothetical protein
MVIAWERLISNHSLEAVQTGVTSGEPRGIKTSPMLRALGEHMSSLLTNVEFTFEIYWIKTGPLWRLATESNSLIRQPFLRETP